MSEIRVSCSPGEARIGVIDGARLLDFALWRPGRPDDFGSVHALRVTAPMEAMGGAFGRLADGRDVFLTGQHQVGALVVAQVTRSAQGGKGLRLKPLEVPHTGQAPELLRPGATPLDDLAARYPDAPITIDDPAFAARIGAALRHRLTIEPRAFDDATADLCDSLTQPSTTLPGGLRATFSPTPALVAVDLDDPGQQTHRLRPTAQVGANIAVLPELARQIRLRNLSGAILVDPAGITPRKRPALVAPFREALAGDPMKAQLLGTTHLGLLEIVRTRGRAPLHEALRSPHGIGLQALRAIVTGRLTGRVHSPNLHVSLVVAEALRADRFALDGFSAAYGAPVVLCDEPDFPVSHWRVDP